jgi:hypothetical protein
MVVVLVVVIVAAVLISHYEDQIINALQPFSNWMKRWIGTFDVKRVLTESFQNSRGMVDPYCRARSDIIPSALRARNRRLALRRRLGPWRWVWHCGRRHLARRVPQLSVRAALHEHRPCPTVLQRVPILLSLACRKDREEERFLRVFGADRSRRRAQSRRDLALQRDSRSL